ncbi:MAG: hypothetical protein U0524_03720 [Candidatus Saccharimonadales bacterium]
MTYKTKRRWAKSLLFLSLLFVFGFSTFAQILSPALGPGTARAANENYVFYYPKNTETIGAINKNLRDRDPADVADSTIVYAKDGFWSRLNGNQLSDIPFNRTLSNDANDGSDRFDVDMKGEDDDQYIFTTDYLCYDNGKTLQADQSKGQNKPESFYLVSIGVVVELGSKFQDKKTYDTSVFPLWIKKFDQYTQQNKLNGDDRQYETWTTKDYDDITTTRGESFGGKEKKLHISSGTGNFTDQVDDVISGSGIPGGCIPPPYTDYQEKTDNYWENKDKWKQVQAKINAGETPDAAGSASGADEPTLECDTKFLNPLSWVSCPIIDGLSTVVSELDSLITSQLSVGSPGNSEEPNQIFCSRDTPDTDVNECSSYHKAWSVFRNLALGILVIIGLLMILSEMAGMEIFDAYTVRKTLPRLVVGAIGITLSWQLMQFLVEFTNALGYGIRYLIYQPFLDSGIDTAVLQGGGKAAVGLLGLSGFFLLGVMGMMSFVATAAIGVIVAFLTLVVREIIIIAAVIISPIAIALYILPNTERFYKMWWDTFFKALMMFPLIAAMIASGRVFAALASNGGTVSQILGFAAYFAPYFLMPMTFKYAGAAIAGIGGALNNNELTNVGRKSLGQYRARKRQENWANAKNFQRFSDRNMFTRGLNRVGGVVANPGALKGGRTGVRNARLTGLMAHGAETLKNDRIHQQHQHDDNYLMALGNRELAMQKLNKSKEERDALVAQGASAQDISAKQAEIDARQQGLDVASQVASRNDAGVQLAALNQLAQTGYQFSAGSEGYQEVKSSVEKIVGAGNRAQVGEALNNMQYAFKAGGRADLAGINHGGRPDMKSGLRKMTSYQRSQGKTDTYVGGIEGFIGKYKNKDGEMAVPSNPAEVHEALQQKMSAATTDAERDAALADIMEYREILASDRGSATPANAKVIDQQLAGIDSFALQDEGDWDRSVSMDKSQRRGRQILKQRVTEQKNKYEGRRGDGIPEAERNENQPKEG